MVWISDSPSANFWKIGEDENSSGIDNKFVFRYICFISCLAFKKIFDAMKFKNKDILDYDVQVALVFALIMVGFLLLFFIYLFFFRGR